MSLAAVLYVVLGNRGGAGMLDFGPWQGEAVWEWGISVLGSAKAHSREVGTVSWTLLRRHRPLLATLLPKTQTHLAIEYFGVLTHPPHTRLSRFTDSLQ